MDKCCWLTVERLTSKAKYEVKRGVVMSQKNILVIGGASGIGKDVVFSRANNGDTVFFTDLNKEAGESLQKQVEENGGKSVFIQHNVTSWQETKAIIDNILNNYGKIDALVHSAGITFTKSCDNLTYHDWRKTFQVNLTGLFYSIKAILPSMLKNGGGKIVIVGSGSSITGSGGGVHYAGSKGGAIGLMRAVAKEYSHQGININLIAPRVIKTPMLEELYPTKESKEQLINTIPTRKLGTLSDTTNAINFLISDESSYIQGNVLLLDGGRTYLSS